NGLDVGPRAEGATGAGDEEQPDLVVVLGLFVGGPKFGDHVRAERVEGVRAVQCDGGGVPVDVVLDGVEGVSRHPCSLHAYRPWKSGVRRCRKASRPSLKSLVRHESSRLKSSWVMDWLSDACWPKFNACLASPIATVGPQASRASSFSTVSS